MSDSILFPTKPLTALPAGFQAWNFTSAIDPSLHLQLALPQTWTVAAITEDAALAEDRPFVQLALMNSAKDSGTIEVACALLLRECHPADWLEEYLRRRGHRIMESLRVPSPFGDVGSYLSSAESEGKVLLARTIGIKDADRIFLLQGRAADTDFQAHAATFGVVEQSLHLLHPSLRRCAEPITEHSINRPVACVFLVPSSWQSADDEPQPAGGRGFLLLNGSEEAVRGQIMVQALPRHAVENQDQLLSRFAERLAARGLSAPQMPLATMETGPAFSGGWRADFTARSAEAEAEITLCVLEHPRAWLVFGLISVPRQADPVAYMVNRRAFDIALETLALSSGGT